jgi:hypothetical protein
MPITNALASLSVKTLSSSAPWYEKLFGRKPDSTPMPEVAEWKFERGGWLQIYSNNPTNVGKCPVTLAVTSIDEQVASLKAIGIDPGKRIDNETMKVVMIKDPDGNSIAFAQAVDPKAR